MSDYLKKRMQHILSDRPLQKKDKKPIAPKSAKRLTKEAAEREARGDNDTELQKWFKSRMRFMGERCYECGAKVENKIYRFAILSICHILPKRDTMCPSVKYHPLNWITLCPDHHTEFDNSSWKDIETWGCWETIRDRLVLVYEELAESEKRHFPESVLQWMKNHDNFT